MILLLEKVNISTIARKSKLHFYYEGKLTTAAGGKVNISIASEQCKHSTIAGESKHYYYCWEKYLLLILLGKSKIYYYCWGKVNITTLAGEK